MMNVVYESEAAGLRVYEDSENPTHVETSFACVYSAELPLPWAELPTTVMRLIERATTVLAEEALLDHDGTQFGVPVVSVRESDDGTKYMRADLKYWPALIVAREEGFDEKLARLIITEEPDCDEIPEVDIPRTSHQQNLEAMGLVAPPTTQKEN